MPRHAVTRIGVISRACDYVTLSCTHDFGNSINYMIYSVFMRLIYALYVCKNFIITFSRNIIVYLEIATYQENDNMCLQIYIIIYLRVYNFN